MITQLFGTYQGMNDDGTIIVMTNGGIGYGIVVHDRDREILNVRGKDSEVFAYTRATYLETKVTLYGFLELDDKRVFDRVTALDGLGPATVLRLLSLLTKEQLKAAIDGKEVATLCKVPGIGKKTAEKIIDGVRL
jgi:Holliday junction DNA helicase RuvA